MRGPVGDRRSRRGPRPASSACTARCLCAERHTLARQPPAAFRARGLGRRAARGDARSGRTDGRGRGERSRWCDRTDSIPSRAEGAEHAGSSDALLSRIQALVEEGLLASIAAASGEVKLRISVITAGPAPRCARPEGRQKTGADGSFRKAGTRRCWRDRRGRRLLSNGEGSVDGPEYRDGIRRQTARPRAQRHRRRGTLRRRDLSRNRRGRARRGHWPTSCGVHRKR